MDARTLSMQTIFGQDRRYVVPLFQRPYVWQHVEQWEPFWADVEGVADRLLAGATVRPHFMGAIVLDQQLQPLGNLETRLVIDGQQRLTTIQLLLEAFCDIAKTANAEAHHLALLKLTRNDDPLSDDDDEQFKIWPTNADQDHFRKVILCETPAELKDLYGVSRGARWANHPIADAYLFFHEQLEAWLRPEDEGLDSRVSALYRAVREYLRMVVIDLGSEDEAQLIFETLNARGTPLLPSDLVKNHLFHMAEAEGHDIDALYGKSWSYFDDESGYWREEITRGRTHRVRLDVFLQYFLVLKAREEILVSRLYKGFQEYSAGDGSGSARTQLEELKHYGEIFQSFEQQADCSRLAVFFGRLEELDTTTAYPFLLELFNRYSKEADELEKVVVDIESFLVRRLICGLTTKNYNKIFVELVVLLDKADGKPSEKVREHLLKAEGDSNRWPRDAEFKKEWLQIRAFRKLVRKRTRMLLEAIEQELYTDLTERVEIKDKLTVEHLMPQQWRKHWRLPTGVQREVAEEERERLLHTFGNLTLLTSKLNPKVSNGPWRSKRPSILKHSALNMNRELQEWKAWNEEAIRERGDQMCKIAMSIWKCPATQ